MSILALYHRIGSGKQGLHVIVQSRSIWATATFISAFTIAVTIVSLKFDLTTGHTNISQVQIFSCLPVHAAWDVELIPIMCINSASFMHAQGAINVFIDVLLLLYPLPLLPLLKFNKRQRSKSRPHLILTSTYSPPAALIVIFSIGLIPVISSIMRLCEIVMSGNAIQTGMAWQQADSSW